MTNYIHTKLGDDRRVAIPAKVCDRLGIAAGDPLVLEETADSLRLIPCAHVLREVQAVFAAHRTEGESLVDELIAARRAEAAREDARD
jgi:AbrB family looped-hinge helix DNA binding protein